MALAGNLAAIKEIADRIDGKPAQTTIIEEDNRQDLEDFTIPELKQILADGLRREATARKKDHCLRVRQLPG